MISEPQKGIGLTTLDFKVQDPSEKYFIVM